MDMLGLLKTLGTAVSNFFLKGTKKILQTDYGFQLAAKIMPYSTCFSHSVSNLLSAIGIHISPDDITKTVNNAEYQNWVRQNVSWAVGYFGRLQTVWQVQERFIKKALSNYGKTEYSVIMNWATSRAAILERLDAGFPVVIDSYPTYSKTNQKLGHIVAVVGYIYEYIPQQEDFQSPEQYNQYVTFFGAEPRDCYVIDDPFGNMLANYRGNERVPHPVIGDDLILPFEYFDSDIRGKFSLSLRRG